MYPMINNGFSILDQYKLNKSEDIDLEFVSTFGFPKDKGGPM